MSDPSQATLDLRVAYAVACAISSDKQLPVSKRSILIDITKDGTTYVGTDGQVLLAEYCPRVSTDRLTGKLLLQPEVLKEFKLTKSGDVKLILQRAREHSMMLSCGGVSTEFDLVRSTDYPDWRKIIPTVVSNEAAQFSDNNISRLLKAGTIFGAQRVMTLAHNGAGAAIVRWGDLPTAFGLISPYALDGSEPFYAPDWAAPSSTQSQQ
jgi:hypothetical protein